MPLPITMWSMRHDAPGRTERDNVWAVYQSHEEVRSPFPDSAISKCGLARHVFSCRRFDLFPDLGCQVVSDAWSRRYRSVARIFGGPRVLL